jgi:hypothetical protein
MPKAFLMTTDLGLVFDTNLSIDEDYEASDFHSIDLWSRHEPRPPGTGRLVYSSRYRSPRFDAYDYFPDTGSIAIVSDRLKFVFEQICSAGEVGFYPCEIRFKDITKEVWAAYPLTIKLLVDRQQSEIEWYVPDLQPKELIVKNSTKIVFQDDCLGDLNIRRWRESRGHVVVSEKLKAGIENVNSHGVKFLEDRELIFRQKSLDR